MNMPKIPSAGEVIKAQHIADIIRWAHTIVPCGDGKTIAVTQTAGGSVVTSIGGEGGTGLYPVLVGGVNHHDPVAQKCVYVGLYCTDFDGVTCTTWNACYLTTIYNVTAVQYAATPTAWDFESNTIFVGWIVSYDFTPEGETPQPTLVFTHDRWL